MVGAGGAARPVDSTLSSSSVEPELLGGDLKVAPPAEVFGVLVDIEAAMDERHDVVDPSGDRDSTAFGAGPPADTEAALAEAVSPLQAPLPLTLPRAAAEPLDRH